MGLAWTIHGIEKKMTQTMLLLVHRASKENFGKKKSYIKIAWPLNFPQDQRWFAYMRLQFYVFFFEN